MKISSRRAEDIVKDSLPEKTLRQLISIVYDAHAKSREMACDGIFEDHVRPQMAGQVRWGLIESFTKKWASHTEGILGEDRPNVNKSCRHYAVRVGKCILTMAATRNGRLPAKSFYRLQYSQTNQLELFPGQVEDENDDMLYVVVNFGTYKSCKTQTDRNCFPDWVMLQVPDSDFDSIIYDVDLKKKFPEFIAELELLGGEENVPAATVKAKEIQKVVGK